MKSFIIFSLLIFQAFNLSAQKDTTLLCGPFSVRYEFDDKGDFKSELLIILSWINKIAMVVESYNRCIKAEDQVVNLWKFEIISNETRLARLKKGTFRGGMCTTTVGVIVIPKNTSNFVPSKSIDNDSLVKEDVMLFGFLGHEMFHASHILWAQENKNYHTKISVSPFISQNRGRGFCIQGEKGCGEESSIEESAAYAVGDYIKDITLIKYRKYFDPEFFTEYAKKAYINSISVRHMCVFDTVIFGLDRSIIIKYGLKSDLEGLLQLIKFDPDPIKLLRR